MTPSEANSNNFAFAVGVTNSSRSEEVNIMNI